ncbi:hypothetical protein GIB67_008106, partial [Kingdonia uniflora]
MAIRKSASPSFTPYNPRVFKFSSTQMVVSCIFFRFCLNLNSRLHVSIKWPRSRDEIWKAYIPQTHLSQEKSDQNRMVVKGEKISFPGGGTHFHYGADNYIASLANMLNFWKNNLNNEGRIRTVLDVGSGVASFGAYLFSFNIIAMSVAPNDVHQNQIQFALERGIPTYLGVLGTKRL